ncbi:MAG TPA: ATP-binding cassette domain-containing protein [Bacillota bacterium]|nr:ATP-binding cassette domain-containing protein [Bacillota bacterium]HPE39070.1 ATP-binding cassette domain-containing protein [Bacillota bacterium]
MIEITNLVKYYGEKKAVNGISFTVNQGEVLGFLGPNGAGKSTTMNIITGYLSATSGSVKINGHDILEEPELAKKSIGYLPELPPLYLDMTVLEYLNFICDTKGVSRKERIRQLAEIMRLVKIAHVSDRIIHNLSKGYRQRVGIAQAMIGNPEVLVLDEPTVGLDPKQIIEIRNLIKTLSKKHTVILSSHILPEVQAVCDRVVIINQGKIAAIDSPTALSHRLSGTSKLLLAFVGPFREAQSNLRAIPGVKNVTLTHEKDDACQVEIQVDPNMDVRKSVFFTMANHSWPILEFRSLDPSLEDIFLSVTNSKIDREG